MLTLKHTKKTALALSMQHTDFVIFATTHHTLSAIKHIVTHTEISIAMIIIQRFGRKFIIQTSNPYALAHLVQSLMFVKPCMIIPFTISAQHARGQPQISQSLAHLINFP
jgi:hypothetical protein